uniref:Uncharacterized protein n=1 Tax=Anguilla anguilla TaxID=7936 RepID=A0A0E9W6C5_ANGAN
MVSVCVTSCDKTRIMEWKKGG